MQPYRGDLDQLRTRPQAFFILLQFSQDEAAYQFCWRLFPLRYQLPQLMQFGLIELRSNVVRPKLRVPRPLRHQVAFVQ